jgi:hypothetical protein
LIPLLRCVSKRDDWEELLEIGFLCVSAVEVF